MSRTRPWSAACVVATLLFATLALVADAKEPAETRSGTRIDVKVTGSAIGNITTSTLALTPAFAPSITDYVWRCQAGTNAIHVELTAVPGGTLHIGPSRGSTVSIDEDLLENQALVISAPWSHSLAQASGAEHTDDEKADESRGRTEYWIRCLPHDFPALSVTRPGNPPPGWYLTGNVTAALGSSTYAMVLDNNGTPVWFRKTSGIGAIDVTPLPSNTIAWISFGDRGFYLHSLNSGTTSIVAAATPPTDIHELETLSNGDYMVISSPERTGFDLTSLGLGVNATIDDCIIQEVDSAGRLVWEWRASEHILGQEVTHPLAAQVGNVVIYDVFHCNSVDVDPASGNVLLSVRHADAVYLIDKTSGSIIWKLGGRPVASEQLLRINGDPYNSFHAQHDARFEGGGDVSLFDNQSWDSSLAARGVVYHIDGPAATATLVWSYSSPDGHNSLATGSFRPLNDGTDDVVGWGFKRGTLFTEVDQSGRALLDVGLPNGEGAYRVIKVLPELFNHSLLRATAG